MNGDEIHLLMESEESGIQRHEEIGMIFVVLRDLSVERTVELDDVSVEKSEVDA